MLVLIALATKPVDRRCSAWLGVCAWLVVSSGAGSVAAQERAFALTWSAPADCPDAATVEGYIEDDVGTTAYGPTAVRARGSVSRSPDARYSVALQLDTGGAQTSTRLLEGGSCQAVSQAAALLVALAIRAQAAPVARPVAPVRPPGPTPPSAHERAFLAAKVLADLGSLPGAAVGLGISGGATISGLRLEPELAYFAPRSGNAADGAGARFTLASAGARLCTPFPRSELWFAPCVGGGVDWTRARGFGARVPQDASTVDVVLTAAALSGWDISPIISLRLELAAVLPLARPEYDVTEVDGVGVVYRRAPLALRGNLGLELHF